MSRSPEGDWTTTVLSCGHEVLDPDQVHYCDYISLDALIALTRPHAMNPARARDPAHHDEHQFVVVHQICELIFHMALLSLRQAIAHVEADEFDVAARLLKRARLYIRTAKAVMDPLRTMTQEDFLEFRPLLLPASGMESKLYRLLEIYAGLRADSPYASMHGRTFTFRQFLDRPPIPGEGPGYAKTRIWTQEMSNACADTSMAMALDAAATRQGLTGVRSLFLPDRQEEHPLYRVTKFFLLFEDEFQKLRKMHVLVAESQIGRSRMGTGHTTGVQYLESVIETARFHPILRTAWNELRSIEDLQSPDGA